MFNRKKVKNLQERILNLERLIFRTADFLELLNSPCSLWTDNPEWQLRSYLDKKFDEKKQQLKEAEIRRIAEQVYDEIQALKEIPGTSYTKTNDLSGLAGANGTLSSPSYKE